MTAKQNKMAVFPIPKLIVSVSVPLMISMLVQSLYNIVDGIFVARLGENAVTATSVAYSAQMLMLAVAVGTGVGINSLLSRSLGKRDMDAVEKTAANGLLLSMISALVFMIAGAVGSQAFIKIFTASSAEIVDLGTRYLRICMVGCAGIFLATTGERLLQATGNTLLSMLAQLFGAIVNIVLDPILIFRAGMGIEGAAVATIIGQFGAAFAALGLNAVKNKEIHFRLKNFKPDADIVLNIYKVGVPTMFMQTMGSFMMMAMTKLLAVSEYTYTAVAFYGIYYKLWTFVYMPVSGLVQGLIPIVGFNFGAKNGKRIREAFRLTLIIAVGIMCLGTVLFMLLPEQLLNLYNASAEMKSFAIPAMRILCVAFPLAGVTITIGFCCSGMGNGMVSMIGTLIRQLIVLVPLSWLFNRTGGFGCIWYAAWVSECLAAIYAVFTFRSQYRKKVKLIL